MNLVIVPASAETLLQLAWEELMGETDFSAKRENAHEAFSFNALAVRLEAWRRDYGLLAGDGLALLLGRAFWRHWLRLHPTADDLRSLSFRLLPQTERQQAALKTFADFIQQWTSRPCRLRRAADGEIRWEMDGLLEEGFFWSGALMALTAWVSGDKVYPTRFDFSADAPALIIAAQPL